jgi:hypothetical protein
VGSPDDDVVAPEVPDDDDDEEDDDDDDDDDEDAPASSVAAEDDERSDAPEINPHADASPHNRPRTTLRPTLAFTNVIVSLMPFSARG